MRQKLAGDSHVGVLPAGGDINPTNISTRTRRVETDGKNLANGLETVEKLGKTLDTFIPGRKLKNLEPFTLREGNTPGIDVDQEVGKDLRKLGADLVTIIQNTKADLDEQATINAKNRLFRAKNLAGELLQQRRDIAGEIFSDYLTTDKSTNLHHVYQRKKQDNIKKERLVQTKQYEMNIYNEYLNLGKILVIAFVLFVLAKVLNNKGIMGDSLTELFTALIIIITIIYIIWKLVWLGLRDPINFHKTNQGYDRQYVKNMQGNKYPPKIQFRFLNWNMYR